MADAEHVHGLVSRKEAIRLGLKSYYTGVPCKSGHLGLRITGSAVCRECARLVSLRWKNENKESLNSQAREWRKNNPEEATRLDRWEYSSRRDHHKARARKYYKNNREKHIAASREYFWKNRAVLNEKARARTIRWAKNNPEKVRAAIRNYKSRKRGNGGTHTGDDRIEIFRLQRGKCAFCRISLSKAKKHLDHIVPLARGGRNDRSNLQFLCESCNLRKGARDQINVMRQMGMLL